MNLDSLTNVSGEWLKGSGPESDIVISSRIRLARNLAAFPGNAFNLGSSVLNFTAGSNRANNAILYLATDGSGTIGIVNQSAGTTNVTMDVVGYFN